VVLGREEGPPGERVYLHELSAYLGVPLGEIRKFCREHCMELKAGMGSCRLPIGYCTPQSARNVILYFRSRDGAFLLDRSPKRYTPKRLRGLTKI